MRVLILHNRYRAEGGEERAVGEIAAMLDRRGHTVQVLERSSRAAGRGRAGRAMLAGGEHPEEVSAAVRALGADVVHAHNLHPLFGWRALAAAQAAGARTVLHLHNYRLFCAIGVAFRQGGPCYSCRGQRTLPGLVHRCRGSLPEAAVYAAGLSSQQPSLIRHADRLVVLSQAHGDRLRQLGLPGELVRYLPNFVPDAGWVAESRADAGQYALVAGRLVPEKGFDMAIRAAALATVPLVVAGSGPDEARLRGLAAGSEVRFTGWLEPEDLARLRANAAVLLAPSRWEEPCPYSVLDAVAAGVPTLVSDLGGLPELAGPGAALPPDDPGAWADALGALWRDGQGRRSCGEAALQQGRQKFGEDLAYAGLMAIYGWVP